MIAQRPAYQAEAEAVRAAEARGDALRQRGDEVARENDQLRAQLEVAEEPYPYPYPYP